jgi:hypothetical protein
MINLRSTDIGMTQIQYDTKYNDEDFLKNYYYYGNNLSIAHYVIIK